MNGDIRDQLAKGYEAIENAKACFDKAKEMLDAKDAKPPRNWPERIEAGMCFRWGKGLTYIYVQGGTLANIESGETFDAHLGFNGRERDFTYLGHARDILAIRTAAHEPTGAELVGRVVEVSGTKGGRPVTAWSPTLGVTWADDDMIQSGAAAWHKDARIAK